MERQSINLFDELLRLSYLDQLSKQEPELTATAIQSLPLTEDENQLSESRLANLRNRLVISLTAPTLGELLEGVIQTTTPVDITARTGLPATMIDRIRIDQLYPTQIPVMMMKRLLLWLQIPFMQAEAAMRKTAERFNALAEAATPQYGMAPLGRKAGRHASYSSPGKAGGRSRDLYANEEALQMYLNRLEQEMA